MKELAPADNPYAPPQAELAGPEPLSGEELTRDEVFAFCGPNAHDFWDNWQPLGQTRAPRALFAGLTFAVLIFPIPWLAYRKMLVEALSVLLIMFLGGGVLLVIVPDLPTLALEAIVRLPLAFVAKGLYLMRARRVIRAARRVEPDPQRRLDLLRARGGTSTIWMIVAVVALIALRAIGK